MMGQGIERRKYVRKTSLVLPLARKIGFLRNRHIVGDKGSFGINALSVGSSALLRSIATTVATALSVCRSKLASVNDRITAVTF